MEKADEADTRIESFFTSVECPAPSRLDLSNLCLTRLPKSLSAFIAKFPAAAARLTILNLAHNQLSDLPHVLTTLPNLRILFCLANRFTSIPPVIRALSSLTMLSFKTNALTGEISGSSLPPNCNWLILTSNSITSLAPDFPSYGAKIQKLMLSNNKLSALPESFGMHMTSLQLLRLANNSFETFPSTLFELPRLAWLSLAGNRCTGGPIRSVSELPSHLRIRDIEAEYDVDWSSPLGEGTSGAVYSAVHKASGKRVACKRFECMEGSDGLALDEVFVSLRLRDVPGLIRAIGFALYNENSEHASLILVMELVPGRTKALAGPPSFESITRDVYPPGLTMSASEAERVVHHVEGAMRGLLDQGVAHGDCYAHNILIGEEDGENEAAVVLGDLGAAWIVNNDLIDGVRRIEMRSLAILKEEMTHLVR